MASRELRYSVAQGQFAICQLPSGSAIPGWASSGAFFSITATDEELSIVCQAGVVPTGVKADGPFVCLKLRGPFPLNETGVLSSFIQPLAAAAIPVFAIATYNTDYVLISERFAASAEEVLRAAGHNRI